MGWGGGEENCWGLLPFSKVFKPSAEKQLYLGSYKADFNVLKNSRVRGCRFVQFCKYFYRLFLSSESYLFICHCQPYTQ